MPIDLWQYDFHLSINLLLELSNQRLYNLLRQMGPEVLKDLSGGKRHAKGANSSCSAGFQPLTVKEADSC